MSFASLVIAYHGCDITTRDDLVSGRTRRLRHSRNKYDWLGAGAYFFEGDIERALIFAQAAYEDPARQYTARPIATPAVAGAVLQVNQWLDMTTQVGIREFTLAYEAMVKGLHEAGADIPQNRTSAAGGTEIIYRALDSAVFNFIHATRAERQPASAAFDGVRAAFHQGTQVAPESGFHANTHVQIALRNDDCVLGWFLPQDARLLNESEYAQAKSRLESRIAANRKPRVRAPG